jgi:hypothetical protein
VSSLSFLVAAFVTKNTPLGILWFVSTVNHMGQKWIFIIDESLVHTICVWSMLNMPRSFLYWLSCAWTIGVYKVLGLSHLPYPVGDYWHASTHVVSSIGMVAASPEPVNWPWFMGLFSFLTLRHFSCVRQHLCTFFRVR